MFKSLAFIFSFFFLAFQAPECTILKNGKFTYKRGKDIVQVQFDGNNHTEIHNNGKHYIKSTIEWISDCKYYLTLKEINFPNFPFKPGTKLQVDIIKVNGNNVYYKSSIKKRSWEGKLTKVTK